MTRKHAKIGRKHGKTTPNPLKSTEIHTVSDRRKIQFAVDGIWPELIPANAGIRVEFKLSASTR